MNVTEQSLNTHRASMTLLQRVKMRRALDIAADETYAPVTAESVARLARIMSTGLRRAAA